MKEIIFDDNSKISFELKNGELIIILQAKNPETNEITASSAQLTKEETLDVMNWLGNQLATFHNV